MKSLIENIIADIKGWEKWCQDMKKCVDIESDIRRILNAIGSYPRLVEDLNFIFSLKPVKLRYIDDDFSIRNFCDIEGALFLEFSGGVMRIKVNDVIVATFYDILYPGRKSSYNGYSCFHFEQIKDYFLSIVLEYMNHVENKRKESTSEFMKQWESLLFLEKVENKNKGEK